MSKIEGVYLTPTNVRNIEDNQRSYSGPKNMPEPLSMLKVRKQVPENAVDALIDRVSYRFLYKSKRDNKEGRVREGGIMCPHLFPCFCLIISIPKCSRFSKRHASYPNARQYTKEKGKKRQSLVLGLLWRRESLNREATLDRLIHPWAVAPLLRDLDSAGPSRRACLSPPGRPSPAAAQHPPS